MKKATTPPGLFLDPLKELSSMEDQLAGSLPRLVALCQHTALREIIGKHAEAASGQLAIVKQILEDYGGEVGGNTCKAMVGLIEGGEEHLKGVEVPETRDLMMVAHCLLIEHYEITAYDITSRLPQLGVGHEAGPVRGNLAGEPDTAKRLLDLQPELFNRAQSRQ